MRATVMYGPGDVRVVGYPRTLNGLRAIDEVAPPVAAASTKESP